MGCAIALEVLKIMKRDHILNKVNEDGKYLHQELMKALGHHKNVGEIRHIGLINAIELVEDPATKKASRLKRESAGMSSVKPWPKASSSVRWVTSSTSTRRSTSPEKTLTKRRTLQGSR